MTEMMLSPDCRDGNHQKCNGDAWDLEADGITDCRCGCHDERPYERANGGEHI